MGEKRSFIFFREREEDEYLVRPKWRKIPKWVLKGDALREKASRLIDMFDALLNDCFWDENEVPIVMEVKLIEEAYDDRHRSAIESVFNTSKNNVFGAGDKGVLYVEVDSLHEAKEMRSHFSEASRRYDYGISGIRDLSRYRPIIEPSEETIDYKAKLFFFSDEKAISRSTSSFERYLKWKKVSFARADYGPSLIIYLLSDVSRETIDFIQEDVPNYVQEIFPMPTLDSASNSSSPSSVVIKTKYPDVSKKITTVGVLDSGIEPINHLKPWLVGSHSTYFPGELSRNHGTFVAGVITYGDGLDGYPYTGADNVNLYDFAVTPNLAISKLNEAVLIQKLRDAVEFESNEIRLWNYSGSYNTHIAEAKFSDLAVALDDLQEEYDVLICKSAGNWKEMCIRSSRLRLLSGADSVRSLVVGSVTHDGDVEAWYPSSFSLMGPGPNSIIKPDVAHYGGNASCNGTNLVTSGVNSFDTSGNVVSEGGTSFSTPRVASLCATIMNKTDEAFNPLLLKALVVHSARHSSKEFRPKSKLIDLVGFGVPPHVDDVLYDDYPHEITLILKGDLCKKRRIDIDDFPMPSCLIRGGCYTGQITITLVYDPILDANRGSEYCQSCMNVSLGTYDPSIVTRGTKRAQYSTCRQDSHNLLLKSYYDATKMKCAVSEFAQRDRFLIDWTSRKFCPVKKTSIDLSELKKCNMGYVQGNRKWFLRLDGEYRNNAEEAARKKGRCLSQKYCLVITIRDPDKKVNVYDEVLKELDERGFGHRMMKYSKY